MFIPTSKSFKASLGKMSSRKKRNNPKNVTEKNTEVEMRKNHDRPPQK